MLSVFGQNILIYYFGEGNAFKHYDGALSVHYLDVGHGSCIALQLPDGKVAVIDGGEKEYYYDSRVVPYFKTRIFDSRKMIDYMVLTHPHSDHVGGLVGLIESYNVGHVYHPQVEPLAENDTRNELQKPSSQYTDFLNLANARAGEVSVIKTGIIVETADYRISAFVGTLEAGQADLNEISPIIVIEYASQIFVLTGDAGQAVEARFVESELAEQIFGHDRTANMTTWLQLGHHGSPNSSMYPFLNAIKPNVAIVSVGTRFNNPNAEVLARLDTVGVESIYTTRDKGNIVIRCIGDDIKMFFAFDNMMDLGYIWAVAFFAVLVLCFLNYQSKKD